MMPKPISLFIVAILKVWSTQGFIINKAVPATQTLRYMVQNSDENSPHTAAPIRFLGKGKRAVVRPGVVLIAPNHEYNHFLMRSAVFIHAIGINEYDEHVTRGVIIDHPTAFNMAEMGGGSVYGTLAHNILFQGGDAGNDSAMLLHSYGHSDPDQSVKVECGEMIGTSGIYEGGLYDAMDLVDEGLVDPERFKFFFNYVEFSDNELEGMLAAEDSDGDAWASMEVPSSVILNNDFSRGDGWSYLRNQMRQMMP